MSLVWSLLSCWIHRFTCCCFAVGGNQLITKFSVLCVFQSIFPLVKNTIDYTQSVTPVSQLFQVERHVDQLLALQIEVVKLFYERLIVSIACSCYTFSVPTAPVSLLTVPQNHTAGYIRGGWTMKSSSAFSLADVAARGFNSEKCRHVINPI